MNAYEGNPIVGRWEGGSKYYYKVLTDDGILTKAQKLLRFKEFQSLGVGIPFESTQDGVKMLGGHTLEKVLDQRMVGPVGKKLIVAEVQTIQKKLRDSGWAHCDIKPANVVVKWQKQDLTDPHVWLIDNDFAQRFGSPRYVYTPGINESDSEICDANTDLKGFRFIFNAFS